MTRDLDPIIRYGGMFTIALAYRGTGNNAAVQKLLHFAVSDVNNDVRRAATLCLGFLLLDSPAQCPRLVSLLVRTPLAETDPLPLTLTSIWPVVWLNTTAETGSEEAACMPASTCAIPCDVSIVFISIRGAPS